MYNIIMLVLQGESDIRFPSVNMKFSTNDSPRKLKCCNTAMKTINKVPIG